jgi:hypothetical protein
LRVCLFLEQLKNATEGGLASDRIEPGQERLAINDARHGGAKGRKPRTNEQVFARLPPAPADYARPVIADVFNPRTFRVVRFAHKFKLPQTPELSPVFHASTSHHLFNLLLSLIGPKISHCLACALANVRRVPNNLQSARGRLPNFSRQSLGHGSPGRAKSVLGETLAGSRKHHGGIPSG